MADHSRDRTDSPGPRELDRLQDLMERAGESEARQDDVLTLAALDGTTYDDFVDLYQRKAAQVVTKDVFYPYETLAGPFVIGTDPDGQALGLTREQLTEHLLLVGMTGRGKSTFFYNLMETCAATDLPFMVFDFKNDYRHLVEEQDLLVINWRDFKFNPLEPPPGVQPGKWGEILADTFAHATDLLIGSESYFLDQLRTLYALYEKGGNSRRSGVIAVVTDDFDQCWFGSRPLVLHPVIAPANRETWPTRNPRRIQLDGQRREGIEIRPHAVGWMWKNTPRDGRCRGCGTDRPRSPLVN